MKPAELEPAPKRGQYDRALTRRERQAVQRERVIAALSALSASHRELSIANIVQAAGIGRNTFYEYFDDVEHALASVNARALSEMSRRVDNALQAARTPLERVRALSRAWAESLCAEPATMSIALRAQAESVEPTQLSVLAQYVARVLTGEQAARDALPGVANPLRAAVVAAAFDAVSRSHLRSQPMTVDELQGALSELALRLLR